MTTINWIANGLRTPPGFPTYTSTLTDLIQIAFPESLPSPLPSLMGNRPPPNSNPWSSRWGAHPKSSNPKEKLLFLTVSLPLALYSHVPVPLRPQALVLRFPGPVISANMILSKREGSSWDFETGATEEFTGWLSVARTSWLYYKPMFRCRRNIPGTSTQKGDILIVKRLTKELDRIEIQNFGPSQKAKHELLEETPKVRTFTDLDEFRSLDLEFVGT